MKNVANNQKIKINLENPSIMINKCRKIIMLFTENAYQIACVILFITNGILRQSILVIIIILTLTFSSMPTKTFKTENF